MQGAESAEWPEPEHGLPYDHILLDRPETAAVNTDLAMVSHHEDFSVTQRRFFNISRPSAM